MNGHETTRDETDRDVADRHETDRDDAGSALTVTHDPAPRGRILWGTGAVGAAVAGVTVVVILSLFRIETASDGVVVGEGLGLTWTEAVGALLVAAVAGALSAEPWRALRRARPTEAPWEGAGAAARARVSLAVSWYDFWLEYYGMRGGRRRVARDELRANLVAAAQDASAGSAITSIGGLRRLARETAGAVASAQRLLWHHGLVAAALTLAVLLFLFFGAVTHYTDGVVDATGTQVESFGVSVGPRPGDADADTDAEVGRLVSWGAPVLLTRNDDGTVQSVEAQLPAPWLLLVPAAFVVVAARGLVTRRR